MNISVPPPKFYVQVNPILVIFDPDTCLWLNSFLLNLFRSLMDPSGKESTSSFTYIDVKIEAILPRVGYCGVGLMEFIKGCVAD